MAAAKPPWPVYGVPDEKNQSPGLGQKMLSFRSNRKILPDFSGQEERISDCFSLKILTRIYLRIKLSYN